MKFFLSFIVCLFMATSNSSSQYNNRWPAENNDLCLIISSKVDTFILGDKMLLEAKIINRSKRSVILPKDYSLISNLYPNGNSSNSQFVGGLFKLQIDTMPRWSAIYAENIFTSKEKEFIRIKPDSFILIKIDIGNQINTHNQEFLQDSLKIINGHSYTFQLTYSSKIENGKNAFKGQLVSNKIKLMVKSLTTK